MHERGDVGDLVYEEELAARRPARPPGEHRLHEAHEADEVIIVRPERPQLMMGQGLTLRVLAGVVHADKHSWKRASVNKSAFNLESESSCFVVLTLLRGPRRHHVLVPDSMRTGGQGQVAGRRVRPLPEWHRDRELGSGWVVLQLRLSLQHCSVWKSAHFQYNSQETVTRVTIDMSGNNKIQ